MLKGKFSPLLLSVLWKEGAEAKILVSSKVTISLQQDMAYKYPIDLQWTVLPLSLHVRDIQLPTEYLHISQLNIWLIIV